MSAWCTLHQLRLSTHNHFVLIFGEVSYKVSYMHVRYAQHFSYQLYNQLLWSKVHIPLLHVYSQVSWLATTKLLCVTLQVTLGLAMSSLAQLLENINPYMYWYNYYIMAAISKAISDISESGRSMTLRIYFMVQTMKRPTQEDSQTKANHSRVQSLRMYTFRESWQEQPTLHIQFHFKLSSQ